MSSGLESSFISVRPVEKENLEIPVVENDELLVDVIRKLSK